MMEHVSSELLCPKCKETLSRTAPGCSDPSDPVPDPPENGANVTYALGLAYCERCDVMHSWELPSRSSLGVSVRW